MNKTASILIGLVLFAAFLAVLTWQMLGNRKHRVEVCMSFMGEKNCAIATGPSKAEAIRTATSTACTTIAGGVTETMACERAQPLSIRELE